jgi:thioredoxin-like negative regulator of GroEL
MATSLNVRSIPMLIGFNDGKSVSVKVGVVPETQIIEMANNIS